jgi:outer membrane autotransporter protein
MSSASPNYLGQSNNMIRVLQLEYDFWAEGNYQREFVDYDASAWDYDVSRGGLMVGMDVKLGDRMTTGFVFGYGNPHVSNTIGKIAADDIMFGIYSGFRTYFGCTLNTYLGYGVQNFTYKHNLSEATYGGDAAYLSAELSRPFQCGIFGQLTPLFALDYQKTWTDGFITPDTQQIIDKNDLNQFVLRFGLNSKIAPIQQLNIRTRLHYGYQVAGDTFGSATTAFQLNPETKQTLTSVNRGRNRLDIGIGTDLYTFDRRTRFFIDYNFTYGNKATAHTTQFGLVSTR